MKARAVARAGAGRADTQDCSRLSRAPSHPPTVLVGALFRISPAPGVCTLVSFARYTSAMPPAPRREMIRSGQSMGAEPSPSGELSYIRLSRASLPRELATTKHAGRLNAPLGQGGALRTNIVKLFLPLVLTRGADFVPVRLHPVYEWATYPANLCPLFGWAEFAGFREDLGQPIGEPVEAVSRRPVRQGSTEHFDCVLSEEQRVNNAIQAGAGRNRWAFGCGARCRGCERAKRNSRCRSFEVTSMYRIVIPGSRVAE